jgi:micrococcal nuclease
MMRAAILLAALSLAAPAFAHEVIGISDGDTLTLLVDRKPLKVRLANMRQSQNRPSVSGRNNRCLTCATAKMRPMRRRM